MNFLTFIKAHYHVYLLYIYTSDIFVFILKNCINGYISSYNKFNTLNYNLALYKNVYNKHCQYFMWMKSFRIDKLIM